MRAIALLVVLLVLLAGCGGPGKDAEPPGPTPPTSTAPPTGQAEPPVDTRTTHPDAPGLFVSGHLRDCGRAHCWDVFAENEGPRTYYYSGCIPPWQYAIRNGAGAVQATHRREGGIPACIFSDDPIDARPIPPGSWQTRTICWDWTTDNGDRVPAGTYEANATVTILRNDNKPEGEGTDPVQVTISTQMVVGSGPQPSCR